MASEDLRLQEIDAIVRRYLADGCQTCRVSSGLVSVEVSRTPSEGDAAQEKAEAPDLTDTLASEDGEPAHIDRIEKIKELSYYSS